MNLRPDAIDLNRCYLGDCRTTMRQLIAAGIRVQCIVTSPPYWGLRDYGHEQQIGLEPTFAEFLQQLVEVFDLCRQLLADDGTLWLNMGDSYAGSWGAQSRGAVDESSTLQGAKRISGRTISARQIAAAQQKTKTGSLDRLPAGIKAKDLIGQPWRLAFALQDAGWWLRQDIIWSKPNPMPESVRDRCTKAHEYLFLLTKSAQYFFDFEAFQEPVSGTANARSRQYKTPDGWDTSNGAERHGSFHKAGREKGQVNGVGWGYADNVPKPRTRDDFVKSENFEPAELTNMRNRRSVWTVQTEACKEAHFATFPQALVEPCIIAGSRTGDIVFDPFLGSGTVARVAQRLGRDWLGCELNPEYVALIEQRTQQMGLGL